MRIDDAIGTEISYVDHPANSMATIEQVVQKAEAEAALEEARDIIRKSAAPSHDAMLDLAEAHIQDELDKKIESRRKPHSEMPMEERQREAVHLARTLAANLNLDKDELTRRAFTYARSTDASKTVREKAARERFAKTIVAQLRLGDKMLFKTDTVPVLGSEMCDFIGAQLKSGASAEDLAREIAQRIKADPMVPAGWTFTIRPDTMEHSALARSLAKSRVVGIINQPPTIDRDRGFFPAPGLKSISSLDPRDPSSLGKALAACYAVPMRGTGRISKGR